MSTIREQIITAIDSKLGQVLVSKGYQINSGNKVLRGIRPTDPDDLPAISFFPRQETATREYGNKALTMVVHIESMVNFESENPSVVSEKMLGDMIEAIIGKKWIVPFTSGGTYRIKAGDTITGHTSSATGYVENVSVSTGTWGAGTAAGNITIRRKSGTFQAENIDVGTNLNVATTTGSLTYQSAIQTTTNSLASDIQYVQGGIEEYPQGGDKTIGISTTFNVIYEIETGNPFAQ